MCSFYCFYVFTSYILVMLAQFCAILPFYGHQSVQEFLPWCFCSMSEINWNWNWNTTQNASNTLRRVISQASALSMAAGDIAATPWAIKLKTTCLCILLRQNSAVDLNSVFAVRHRNEWHTRKHEFHSTRLVNAATLPCESWNTKNARDHKFISWCWLVVLWRCWLGGRKGIRPIENWVVGCWRGYMTGARCRLVYTIRDAILTCARKPT